MHGTGLFDEILAFKHIFGLNNQNTDEILHFFSHKHLPFPNLATALPTLLIVPVSVASERSFFNLKQKTYLKSSITSSLQFNFQVI